MACYGTISFLFMVVVLFSECMIFKLIFVNREAIWSTYRHFREICSLTVQCLNLYVDMGRQRVHAKYTGIKGDAQDIRIRQALPITADKVATGARRSPGPEAR